MPVDGLLFVSVGRAVGPPTPPSAGTPATLVVGGSCNGRASGRWLLASGGTVLAAPSSSSSGRVVGRRHHQLLLAGHHHVAHVHLSFFLSLSLRCTHPTCLVCDEKSRPGSALAVWAIPSFSWPATEKRKKENEILALVLPSFLWVRAQQVAEDSGTGCGAPWYTMVNNLWVGGNP